MLINEMRQGGIRALLSWDSTIFDGLNLPDDIDSDDFRGTLIDTIIYKYGDAPLYTPDPEVLKYQIERWSYRRQHIWQRYLAVLQTEYDPIENYNRMELRELKHGKSISHLGTITDATRGKITDSSTGTITDTPTGTIKVERDDVTTDDMSADNSATYQPSNKTTLDGETNTSYLSYSEQQASSSQQERTFTGYEEQRTLNHSDTESGSDMEESTIHGNIGVTTSQQMLESEIELIQKLDLIDYIADDWHAEFCLYIYN